MQYHWKFGRCFISAAVSVSVASSFLPVLAEEETNLPASGKSESQERASEQEAVSSADVQEGKPGASVFADESSPSGYTVDFVYDGSKQKDTIAKVEVTGPFNYTDQDMSASYAPYEYQNGMYATNFHPDKSMQDGAAAWGYTAELKDEDQDGIYEVMFPITSGMFGYHYIVTYNDGTSSTIEDPANPANAEGMINVNGAHRSGDTGTSVVRGHWDADKQSHSPDMDDVLPMDDITKRGNVDYVPYTTITGATGYLGVYTPAGYDENRDTPYKTIYLSHGGGGDEQDWFHMGSANNIMDHMIADGVTEPALIVTMDNAQFNWNFDQVCPNVMERIVPFMEKNYNVSASAQDRAFMGLSMGGLTTSQMYARYPEQFSFFGIWSAATAPEQWQELYAKTQVEAACGTTDFALGSIQKFDEWARTNISDNYLNVTENKDMTVPGAHDWFTWPQLFSRYLKQSAWKDLNGNERTEDQDGVTVSVNPDSSSDSHYLATFVYDDTDEKNAVKVTVSGNFQWYKWDETNAFDASGDNSSIPMYDAYHYENGMFNAGYGLNGMAEYELTQTEGEHFRLSLPLPGNLYYYDYTVTYADGSTDTIKDPANLPKANATNGHDAGHSLFYAGSSSDTAEGQEEIYARTDDRKGSFSFVNYKAVDGTQQPLGIYLPAGYDVSRTYKTIYVSHGGGGNENEWMTIGAVPNIMDNLIAEGKTEPAVVVTMDNSYFKWDYDQIGPNVTEYIIPYVESHYSVSHDPLDRAICGLSMGSMTTNQMAMRYPETFRYFGSFSGGMQDYDKLKNQFNAEALNKDILFLTAGQIDMARNNTMGISSEDFLNMYDSLGIKYHYAVYGGAHDWGFWRQSFTVFVRDYLWTLDQAGPVETSEPSKKPEQTVKNTNSNKSAGKSQQGVKTGVGSQPGAFGGLLACSVSLAAAAWFILKHNK